jgi:hypothetical protein
MTSSKVCFLFGRIKQHKAASVCRICHNESYIIYSDLDNEKKSG